MSKFAVWFTGEVLGLWFLWASYMAVKFMVEVGQHQHAAFSLHNAVHENNQVGFLFLIPMFISVMGSVIWTVAVASGEVVD